MQTAKPAGDCKGIVKLAALQLRQMAPTSTASLGLGLADTFEPFRGGSGSFEEGVSLAEKPTELQGKRSAERCCWLASPEPTASMVTRGSTVRVRQRALQEPRRTSALFVLSPACRVGSALTPGLTST